jgi:hypothetical protein
MSNMISSGKQPQTVHLNVEKDTHPVNCPHCGSAIFNAVTTMRKIPGLLVGQRHDQFQAFQVLQCANCRKIVNFDKNTPEWEPKSVKILRVLGDIFQKVMPFLQKKR